MTSIGIIGNGVVGAAQAKVWGGHCDLFIHDQLRSKDELEALRDADFVFICVPTNRLPDSLECDLSIIDQLMMRISGLNFQNVIVVKSTVPIGSCQCWAFKYNLKVIHYPEFLREDFAITDAFTPSRHVIGYTARNEGSAGWLAAVVRERFVGVPCFTMKAEEAEFVKLSMNALWATKISFFNELRAIADDQHLDWPDILAAMLTDGRVTHSHTQVPGPDGKRGFGGKCLPKDLANLMVCAKKRGVPTPIMDAVWSRNQTDRSS